MSSRHAEGLVDSATMAVVLPGAVPAPSEERQQAEHTDSRERAIAAPRQVEMGSAGVGGIAAACSFRTTSAPTHPHTETGDKHPTCAVSPWQSSLYQKFAEGPDKLAYRGLWFVLEELRDLCSRNAEDGQDPKQHACAEGS
eukprot:TRINITY_DN9144_c0_g1_i1.p1 TRINITY_DN9144_c0_g1~~TRINITY_DN9144_c0_g1_i1.p1  ORF type:complete len:141 (-),score=18.09 TRINITY_DN9144_c0_g1_i1:389-811(-)